MFLYVQSWNIFSHAAPCMLSADLCVMCWWCGSEQDTPQHRSNKIQNDFYNIFQGSTGQDIVVCTSHNMSSVSLMPFLVILMSILLTKLWYCSPGRSVRCLVSCWQQRVACGTENLKLTELLSPAADCLRGTRPGRCSWYLTQTLSLHSLTWLNETLHLKIDKFE